MAPGKEFAGSYGRLLARDLKIRRPKAFEGQGGTLRGYLTKHSAYDCRMASADGHVACVGANVNRE